MAQLGQTQPWQKALIFGFAWLMIWSFSPAQANPCATADLIHPDVLEFRAIKARHRLRMIALPSLKPNLNPLRLCWNETLRFNRYGESFGALYDPWGTWWQQSLVEQGLAFVKVPARKTAGLTQLLRTEATARQKAKGLWAKPETILQIQDLQRPNASLPWGKYVLATGPIRSASKHKHWIYLNFGPDYKTDFTLRLPARLPKALRTKIKKQLGMAKGSSPVPFARLEGSHVLVRGILSDYNGPLIDIFYPDQLMFFPAP